MSDKKLLEIIKLLNEDLCEVREALGVVAEELTNIKKEVEELKKHS